MLKKLSLCPENVSELVSSSLQENPPADLITAAATSLKLAKAEHQEAHAAPTLAQLNATLMMVPAMCAYHIKHKKRNKGRAAD